MFSPSPSGRSLPCSAPVSDPTPLHFESKTGDLIVRASTRAFLERKEAMFQAIAARNRGAHVDVFTDPAAAEAWLKEHVTPEP